MTWKCLAVTAAVVGAVATAPIPAVGQRVQVAATGATVRILPRGQASAAPRYTGVVGGGEVRIAAGPVRLHGWYLQGGLTHDGDGTPRDLVEGALQLGAEPVPWVSLAVGPHVRSYLTTTGTQRWLFWEAHVRGIVALLDPVVRTYLGAWWIAGGSATGVQEFGGGGGLEGGVTLHLPRAPIWGRAAYRLERATLGEADGGETVERLTVSVGISLW